MKKKIFSSLLLAAIGFAVTSSVVSCKDYDDDINDLQSQINKLATQDALTNMQNTLNSAIEGANSKITTLEGKLANYATKAELGEVEKLAKGAQTAAESAGTAASNAQKAANDAAALAKAANDLAGSVKTAAGTAQETADKAKRIAEEALANAAIADGKGQQGIDNAKTALEKALKGIEDAQKAAEVAADALAAGNQGVSDADKARVIAQEAKDLAEQLKKGTEAFVTKAALAEEITKATAQFSPVAENASKALELAQKADGVASQALQKAEQALAAAGSTPSTPGVSKDEVADMIKDVADKLTEAQGLISAAAATAQGTADDALKLAGQAIDDAAAAATLGQQGIDDAAAAATLGQQGIDDAAAAMAAVTSLTQAAYTKAEAETLQGTVDGLVADLAKAATKEELAAVSGETGSVKATVEELFQAVTNVEIYTSIFGNYQDASYYTGAYNNSKIDFVKAEEVNSVFPKNAFSAPEKASEADEDGNVQYIFEKGKIKTFTDEIIIRVSPSNADLTAAQAIKLINSKGGDLDEFVELIKVEQYDKLLTRAANASGLWKVTFKLKDDYVPENFANNTTNKEKGVDGKDVTRNILFAVGVQNTTENRIVCSSYDVTVGASNAKHSNGDFIVKGLDDQWKSVALIHNRFHECEEIAEGGKKISTEHVPELEWKASTKDIPTPAGEVVWTAPDGAKDDNAINRPTDGTQDDRQKQDFLPVVPGKAIDICIDGEVDANGNVVPANKIKGFIVTLDEKYALESHVSELAAWNYYDYENLGKLQKGNLGSITILDNKPVSPLTDIIGFRVYAVNLDGTIVNPDGRSFYVKVMTSVNDLDVALDITAEKRGLLVSDENYTLKEDAENKIKEALLAGNYEMEVLTKESEYYNSTKVPYKVRFLDKDGKEVFVLTGTETAPVKLEEADAEKITQVQFEVGVKDNTAGDIAYFVDGQTYDQLIKVYDKDHVLIQRIACHMTKKMPTDAPKLEFRPKQEVNPDVALPKIESKPGSNAFICFMIPNTYAWNTPWDFMLGKEDYTIRSSYADNGWKDLNNIFYNLNDNKNCRFDFKTSYTNEKDEKNQDSKEVLYGNFSSYHYPGYYFAAQEEYIADEEKTWQENWHDVILSGIFKEVSTTKKDGEITEKTFAQDYAVPSSTTYKALYACWHQAMSYTWKTTPNLQWKAQPDEAGITAKPSDITIKNSYNAALFAPGGTLEKLIASKLVEVSDKAPELRFKNETTGNVQINPYFIPSISKDGVITFKQKSVQSDSNPADKHDEYLHFWLKDAFGHEIDVNLTVTIKKAAGNAKAF